MTEIETILTAAGIPKAARPHTFGWATNGYDIRYRHEDTHIPGAIVVDFTGRHTPGKPATEAAHQARTAAAQFRSAGYTVIERSWIEVSVDS